MSTDLCSRCRLPFKLDRGWIRFHNDHRGNLCPGSGLAPWIDPWAVGAA